MKKVVRDGKVAVVYSPGYGAGWSTWNNSCEWMVFDESIVLNVEKGDIDKAKGEAERIALKLGIDIYVGADELEIEWVDQGTKFKINEYDGYENVMGIDDFNFITA